MNGRLFYLMGASGAGKDSLLSSGRERLSERSCLIASRYITRPPALHGENHLWLSDAEFQQRLRLGAFALHWSANGYRYGIGLEIDRWLELGLDVLINGSRAYLEQARTRYGERLIPLLLQVDPALLERRLSARGRESQEEIAARVERARLLSAERPADAVVIDNSGALETALGQLLQAVQRDGSD